MAIYLDSNTHFPSASAPTVRLPRGWTREEMERCCRCDRCGKHLETGSTALVFCSAAESWVACGAECAVAISAARKRT